MILPEPMKKLVILLILLYSSLSTFSQYSYYKEASIVKKDSSRLSGYIEKMSESSLNPVLKFKKNIEDHEPTIIAVTDVNRVVFHADSSIFENVNYIWRKDSVKITEERLAKKMIEGYASLYKLQLKPEEISIIFEQNNTFVYVVKIDTNYYTLYQKERLEVTSYPGGGRYYPERTGYKLIKDYQGVLYYILKDNKDLSEQVKYLKFSDNQIIPLINKLNSYHSEVKSATVKVKKEKPWISHGPVVSGMCVFKEKQYIAPGVNIGYQIKLIYPQLSEKVSTDLGVFFDRYQLNYGERLNYDFIRIYIGGMYQFNNNVVSPFIGAGLSLHSYLKYIPEPMMSGTIGLNLFKQISASVTLEGIPSFTTNKLNVAPPTHLLFNLGYLFGKK